MIYLFSIFFILMPLFTRFLNILTHKKISSSTATYLYLIIINFSIISFTTTNLANYYFYVYYIFTIAFLTIIVFLVIFYRQFLLYIRSINKNVTSIDNKKIYFKDFLLEILPILLSWIPFIIIIIFYGEPGQDEAAYINMSNSFKNNYFSFGDSFIIPEISFNSYSTYQYTGIYFFYSALSVNSNVVPYYTILSPIIYWSIISSAIVDLCLFFIHNRKKSLIASLLLLCVSILLLSIKINSLRSQNNAIFGLLPIFISLELFINFSFNKSAKWSSSLYLPVFAFCFFSSTGYFYTLPLSFTLFLLNFMDRNVKNLLRDIAITLAMLGVYYSQIKLWWSLFVISWILCFSAIIIHKHFIWKSINYLELKVSLILNHIYGYILNLFKDLKNKWLNYTWIILTTSIVSVLYLLFIKYTPGISLIPLFFLVLIVLQNILISDKFSKNKNWLIYARFSHLIWIVGFFISLSINLYFKQENSSFIRSFFISQGFVNGILSLVLLLFVNFNIFIHARYSVFQVRNYFINFNKLFLTALYTCMTLTFTFTSVARGNDFINSWKTSYTTNIYKNSHLVNSDSFDALKSLNPKKQAFHNKPTLFTDYPSQFYIQKPMINQTSYMFEDLYYLPEHEFNLQFGYWPHRSSWYFLTRTINLSGTRNSYHLNNIALRINSLMDSKSSLVDYLILNKYSSYFQFLDLIAIERNFNMISETSDMILFENKLVAI